MEFNYKYAGTSKVLGSDSDTGLSFSPDLLREPTYFIGKLNKHIAFREAISTLHNVVVSDTRFRPKDKTEYKNWLANQEEIWLTEHFGNQLEIAKEIKTIRNKLDVLKKEKNRILSPFNKAKKEYFKHLYQRDYDAWVILDPVITVHPDQVFFECFSKDESVYGKLSCSNNVFKEINEFKYGTTNIDYSQSLFNEFQKIRDYKETALKIDPSGFNIQTSDNDEYNEVKIDLPDSWVRGFLQVSSAMASPLSSFNLNTIDVYNILFTLKKNKAKSSPRYLKFILKPGEPIKIEIAPFGIVQESSQIYTGSEARNVKIWGRRRLMILERILPYANAFEVFLMGNGFPSFFIAKLDDFDFTLGLSGWSDNDWSSSANFDLLTKQITSNKDAKKIIWNTLTKHWKLSLNECESMTTLSHSDVKTAMKSLAQDGKVIYDLTNGLYRKRELSNNLIKLDEIRYSSNIEQLAVELSNNADFDKIDTYVKDDKLTIKGRVNNHRTSLVLNADETIINGDCNCSYFYKNGFKKGPCEHILALKLYQWDRKNIINKQ